MGVTFIKCQTYKYNTKTKKGVQISQTSSALTLLNITSQFIIHLSFNCRYNFIHNILHRICYYVYDMPSYHITHSYIQSSVGSNPELHTHFKQSPFCHFTFYLISLQKSLHTFRRSVKTHHIRIQNYVVPVILNKIL
jgi:hypothetical protein